MKLQYAFIFAGILFEGSLLTAAPQKFTPIKLNPDFISLIDGKSFAMSGEVIGASIKICRDIQVIQSGKLLPSGEHEGTYYYKNKKHCIKTLVPLELEMKEKLATLNNKQSNDTKIKNEIKELGNDLTTLHELLKTMHANFKQLVDPLMGNAKNSKEVLTMIIEEECYTRGRKDSLLLDWVKLDSDEWDSFGDKVTSFVIFDQFCSDLINFISDLVYNCKKGRAQFEKLLQNYTHQPHKSQEPDIES